MIQIPIKNRAKYPHGVANCDIYGYHSGHWGSRKTMGISWYQYVSMISMIYISLVLYWGDPSRSVVDLRIKNGGSFRFVFGFHVDQAGYPSKSSMDLWGVCGPKKNAPRGKPESENDVTRRYILLGGDWNMAGFYDFPETVGNGMENHPNRLSQTIIFQRGWWLNHQPESHMWNTMFPMRWSGALKWHLSEGCRKSTRLCDVQPRQIVAFSEFGSVLLDFIHGFKMLQVFSSTQEMDRNGLISKMLGLKLRNQQAAEAADWPTFCVKSHLGTGCHGRAADSCHIHVLPRGISERLLGVKSVQREIHLKLYHLLYIYILYYKYMSKQRAIGKLWPVFLCLSCSHYFSSSPDQKVITNWLLRLVNSSQCNVGAHPRTTGWGRLRFGYALTVYKSAET